MTAREAYAQYGIMPILQTHQLRVAAVGKVIAESLVTPVDVRSVILACLFHDMGNIIKFDLGTFPESCEPEGRAFWEKKKADFVRRFGPDEHHATVAIGHELHLPLQVMQYIEGVGFSKLESIRDTHSLGQKIVEYADLRVTPKGVASMDERLEEARIRYAKRRSDFPDEESRYRVLLEAAREIERQIFSRTTLTPENISEESLQTLIEELQDFPLA
ncbi:HD domain-containing protein [Candidatus Kaiserbacteria bacterium]|nr:HD domain-containing protein [Candidatus Kaiserbacteria bacterium]